MEKATFAAGCFWGVEAGFRQIPGVTGTPVGYHGRHGGEPELRGRLHRPTGHAEAVEVDLRPGAGLLRAAARRLLGEPRPDHAQPPGAGRRHAVPLGDLLPLARAGGRGATLAGPARGQGRFRRPIVTEITPASAFYGPRTTTSSTWRSAAAGAAPSSWPASPARRGRARRGSRRGSPPETGNEREVVVPRAQVELDDAGGCPFDAARWSIGPIS